MKKGSWTTDLHDTYDTNKEELGAIREWKGKRYMYVRLDIGADTPAKGDALGFLKSGFTGYTVSTDVSACIADVLAGCIQNETGVDVPADDEYFWMQISGPITLSTTPEDSADDGDGIGLGAADGAVGKATTLKPCGGFVVSASGKTAILDCAPFTYSS